MGSMDDLVVEDANWFIRFLVLSAGSWFEGQKLLVALDGKRPAVIFSDLDISSAMAGVENYKSQGYKPAAARKIVGNIAALLMAE